MAFKAEEKRMARMEGIVRNTLLFDITNLANYLFIKAICLGYLYS